MSKVHTTTSDPFFLFLLSSFLSSSPANKTLISSSGVGWRNPRCRRLVLPSSLFFSLLLLFWYIYDYGLEFRDRARFLLVRRSLWWRICFLCSIVSRKIDRPTVETEELNPRRGVRLLGPYGCCDLQVTWPCGWMGQEKRCFWYRAQWYYKLLGFFYSILFSKTIT